MTNDRLVTVEPDTLINIWDIARKDPVKLRSLYAGLSIGNIFSSDNFTLFKDYLVSKSNFTYDIFNIKTAQYVVRLQDILDSFLGNNSGAIAVSNDKKLYITGEKNEILKYDLSRLP